MNNTKVFYFNCSTSIKLTFYEKNSKKRCCDLNKTRHNQHFQTPENFKTEATHKYQCMNQFQAGTSLLSLCFVVIPLVRHQIFVKVISHQNFILVVWFFASVYTKVSISRLSAHLLLNCCALPYLVDSYNYNHDKFRSVYNPAQYQTSQLTMSFEYSEITDPIYLATRQERNEPNYVLVRPTDCSKIPIRDSSWKPKPSCLTEA